jgi:hypothetical protein
MKKTLRGMLLTDYTKSKSQRKWYSITERSFSENLQLWTNVLEESARYNLIFVDIIFLIIISFNVNCTYFAGNTDGAKGSEGVFLWCTRNLFE